MDSVETSTTEVVDEVVKPADEADTKPTVYEGDIKATSESNVGTESGIEVAGAVDSSASSADGVAASEAVEREESKANADQISHQASVCHNTATTTIATTCTTVPEDSGSGDQAKIVTEVQAKGSHGDNDPSSPSALNTTPSATSEKPPNDTETIVVEDGAIWEPAPNDVLSGRGASVNSQPGNQKFRALCFARKAMFDVANHAAKKRIAREIWATCVASYQSRYLKKRQEKGPWYEQSAEHASLKAAQVMRDYQRPDRVNLRPSGKKRRNYPATPMDDVPIPPMPEEPIVENPVGVEAHDVLCGRGAFVNGHTGNLHLRQLAVSRKVQFDAGNFTEKRNLAFEIVSIIKDLDPPGRFLRKSKPSNQPVDSFVPESEWEELDLEKSIHKACQVMRDIDRQDRKDREDRRRAKKQRTLGSVVDNDDAVEVKANADISVSVESKSEAEDAEIIIEEAIAAKSGESALPEKLGLAKSA